LQHSNLIFPPANKEMLKESVLWIYFQPVEIKITTFKYMGSERLTHEHIFVLNLENNLVSRPHLALIACYLLPLYKCSQYMSNVLLLLRIIMYFGNTQWTNSILLLHCIKFNSSQPFSLIELLLRICSSSSAASLLLYITLDYTYIKSTLYGKYYYSTTFATNMDQN
jgi:hypothetical protein